MSSTLSPEQYFEKIRPLRSPEEIERVCEELTAGLFNETDQIKTRINKLIPYNKLLKQIPNEELVENENAFVQTRADGSYWKRHLHFKFTGLSDVNWNGEGGVNNKTIVLDRLENQQRVDVEKYLETTYRLLLSGDPHELAVGLIAASGRRPVEILARGKFKEETELPNYLKPNYFIRFRGQAKKRDYDMPEEERTEYRIGVLVPSNFFLSAFNRFRKMPETKELLEFLKSETAKGTDPEVINEAIESRRGNSLRRVVASAFGGFIAKRHNEDELNNKALRAIYVRLITERDCPKNINSLLWASRAVGHFTDTTKTSDRDLMHLVTTLGYSDYYVEGEVPFVSAPQKLKKEKSLPVRAFSFDVEVIKNLQKDWELPTQSLVVRNLIELAQKAKNLEKELLEATEQISNLQKQLFEVKAESTNLQKERDKAMNQAAEQTVVTEVSEVQLQPLVEKLVELALQKILPQMQQEASIAKPQPQQNVKTEVKKQPEAKPVVLEKDWEAVPSEELKASKARGAADEKIRRSFMAIADHNDHKARDINGNPDPNQMWFIGNQALRQLSGCNGQLVADWMERHRGAINDHNNKHGLGQYHNKRHKQPIVEVISW